MNSLRCCLLTPVDVSVDLFSREVLLFFCSVKTFQEACSLFLNDGTADDVEIPMYTIGPM